VLFVGCEREVFPTLGLAAITGALFGTVWWVRNGRTLVEQVTRVEAYVESETVESLRVTFRVGLLITALVSIPALALGLLGPAIAGGPIAGALLAGAISCLYLVQKVRRLERKIGARLLWRSAIFDGVARRAMSARWQTQLP
jgi:hypothetical protein